MGQTCLKGDDAVEKRPTRSSGKYEDHATPKESKHNRSVDHSRVTGVSLVSQIESLQHTMRPSVLVVGEGHLHPSFRQFTPLFRPGLSALSVASCEALQLTGQILAVGEDCSIAMTNYETGHVLRRWVHAHERDITCVTRPLAGTRRFATAGRDTVVKVWTVDSDAPLAELCGHTLNVPSVDLLPDGLHAVSGSRDNTVRLWDVETASELCCADIKLNLVRFVRYVPSLQCVAQGGEDMMLRLWDIRCDGGSSAMELPRELPCADYFPVCGDVSEKHPHQFITGHNGVNGTGSFAAEWDLRMGKQVRTYVGHSSTINSVCTTSNTKFYPSGTFITASEDGNINVWESPDDVTSPSQVHPRNVYDLPEGYVTCLETVANGDIIASMRNGCITVLRPQISEKSGETKIAQRFRYIGDPAGRKAGPAAML